MKKNTSSNNNNFAFLDLNAHYKKEKDEGMEERIYHEKDRILNNMRTAFNTAARK